MIISNELISQTKERYSVILADPPWLYDYNLGVPYDQMTDSNIADLEVWRLAEKDSVLYMWATFPKLREALEVFESWGFTYKSGIAWHKITKNGKDYFGNGHWFRSSAELVLFGSRGKPKITNRSVRNILTAPAVGHSIKPDALYDIIESMFPNGKYLELFARRTRKNWTSWGNQVEDIVKISEENAEIW